MKSFAINQVQRQRFRFVIEDQGHKRLGLTGRGSQGRKLGSVGRRGQKTLQFADPRRVTDELLTGQQRIFAVDRFGDVLRSSREVDSVGKMLGAALCVGLGLLATWLVAAELFVLARKAAGERVYLGRAEPSRRGELV